MSEPTVDELREEQARYEAAARVLEAQLDRLDRGTPWRRTLGVEFPRSEDYAADELGTAQYRVEFVRRRAEWLRSRYEELSARAARRERAREAEARGIDRFCWRWTYPRRPARADAGAHPPGGRPQPSPSRRARADVSSVLLDMFRELRAQGRSEGAAHHELARRLGVDTATIRRVLRRAEGDERRPRYREAA